MVKEVREETREGYLHMQSCLQFSMETPGNWMLGGNYIHVIILVYALLGWSSMEEDLKNKYRVLNDDDIKDILRDTNHKIII